MENVETVDEYIAARPKEVREKLKAIRQIIKEAAPEATEKISYGIPYFSFNGRLIYFAAFKDHISLFPAAPSTFQVFKKELSPYQLSKGTIKFSLDKPLPLPLIRKIVKFRVRQNLEKKK